MIYSWGSHSLYWNSYLPDLLIVIYQYAISFRQVDIERIHQPSGCALGIWICGCSLFYKRELWDSKSAGARGFEEVIITQQIFAILFGLSMMFLRIIQLGPAKSQRKQNKNKTKHFLGTKHESYGHSDNRCVPPILLHWAIGYKRGGPKSSGIISQIEAFE